MIRFFIFSFCLYGLLLADGIQTSPHKNLKLACTVCHGQDSESWQTIQFDHQQTGYELSGAHGRTDCLNCHNVTNFSATNRQCVGCHTDVHQNRLTTDCARCHTNNQRWTVFDTYAIHSETGFQILGKHAQLDCFSCHRGEIENRFFPVDFTCGNCHRSDYLATKSPNHSELGFEMTCNLCHTFSGWKPALFKDHDAYFPISSGAHSRVWDDCTTCHKVENDYTEFSCTHCHTHRQSKMDDKHREKRDYVYESHACLSCHPNGRGE